MFGSELRKLKQRYKDSGERFENIIPSVFNSEMNIMLREVKQATPVGISGSLRNNWQATKAIKVKKSYEARMINNLEYASWVENGHIQDKHFTPGRWIANGKFRYIPGLKEGAMFGVKTKHIKGVYMWTKTKKQGIIRLRKEIKRAMNIIKGGK